MRSLLITAGAGLIALAAVAQPAPPSPPAGAPALIDDAGRDRLIAACTGCHDPKVVVGQHHDLAGWQDVIARMVDHGAMVSEADDAAIAAYLAKHYGA